MTTTVGMPSTHPTPNPFESTGRAAKVRRVTELLDRESLARGIDPHRHADQVVRMLGRCDAAKWREIADNAGTRPLSAKSREAVIDVYRARARRQPHRCPSGHVGCYSAACGEDPFARTTAGDDEISRSRERSMQGQARRGEVA